jgi:hypothetical protein
LFGLKTALEIDCGWSRTIVSAWERVFFSLFCPCPRNVIVASQTTAAMTIKGKRALRKKRFKRRPRK